MKITITCISLFVKKHFFLVLLLFVGLTNTSAQTSFYTKNQSKNIVGVVTNSKTGKPIPHVEVFISGTTRGCITDSLGMFSLKALFVPCTLVADHVAYESFITTINKKLSELTVSLIPSNFSVDEVLVTGKNKRRRNLRFFYSHFIPENKSEIKILNDSVLVFKRDKMEFIASSDEPLIIINQLLGYKIKVILNQFKVYSVKSAGGSRTSLNSVDGGIVTSLKGVYYYEPLENESPENAIEFIENRRLSYFGSYRHLLKAMYDDDLKMQGFNIKAIPANKKVNKYKEILLDEKSKKTLSTKTFLFCADKLEVSYCFDDEKNPVNLNFMRDRSFQNYKNSSLYSSKESFEIRENGTSPNLNFIIDGPLAPKNFTNSLPDDYLPTIK